MFKRPFAWLFGRAAVKPLALHVNEAAQPERERWHLDYKVNSAKIRRGVMENGRSHTVIPSFTLPDEVVMNGLLYTHEEIEASYKGLEGKLAPLGHPVVNGEYVSANEAQAIHAHHIGAWNRNVRREGNRIAVDKWVDEEIARNTEGGRKLLEALDKGEPIHTSTGIFLYADLTANGEGYRGTARNMVMDHDAILIGQTGAATPEQGVGLMVNHANIEDAMPLTANERGMFDRFLQWMKLSVNSEPDTKPSVEGNPEMTPEELAAALTANNAKMLEAVKGLVDPVAAAVTKLQANHDKLALDLTANARAAEADKREVVAKALGQVVADALTGNALDEAHAKLVGAAPLVSGFQGNNDQNGYKATELPE